MRTRTRFLTNEAATRALGLAIGNACEAGTTISLEGDLGAGKTTLATGIGAALGHHEVCSPTFVLVQAHEHGVLPLWHADLYRLDDEADLEMLDLDALMGAGGVVLMEWANKFDVLPEDHLVVCLRDAPEGRHAVLSATGPRHLALLERMESSS